MRGLNSQALNPLYQAKARPEGPRQSHPRIDTILLAATKNAEQALKYLLGKDSLPSSAQALQRILVLRLYDDTVDDEAAELLGGILADRIADTERRIAKDWNSDPSSEAVTFANKKEAIAQAYLLLQRERCHFWPRLIVEKQLKISQQTR
jgi:hypothetical protein